MIAFVRGTVADVTLDQRRPRGRRRRPRAACARPTPWPRCASAHAATLPTSMVVREDSLTLFGFLDDDEKPVFELRADRQRRRAQAGPGDARGAHARRRCAARSPATTSRR